MLMQKNAPGGTLCMKQSDALECHNVADQFGENVCYIYQKFRKDGVYYMMKIEIPTNRAEPNQG